MRVVIVSGRSGSGKTITINTLEDLGFWCIDNLPISLLPQIPQALAHSTDVAISLDARNLPHEKEGVLKNALAALSASAVVEIIYLDADDQTLLRRFSETRRKHPLTKDDCDLLQAIGQEKILLAPLATRADLVIDTSKINLHDLKTLIRTRLGSPDKQKPQVLLQSFGYKYGHPADAALIFDTRCLPNPYWQESLSQLSGLDSKVAQYLESCSDVQDMIHDIQTYLQNWVPRYAADNRRYLTVGIGCTGGRHRSVFVAERLYVALKEKGFNALVRHRELT